MLIEAFQAPSPCGEGWGGAFMHGDYLDQEATCRQFIKPAGPLPGCLPHATVHS